MGGGRQSDVLPLPEGGDFEVPQMRDQPSTNFDRSTKLDLATVPSLFFFVCLSAWARKYAFAIFGGVLAGANCKCVWLLALAFPLVY